MNRHGHNFFSIPFHLIVVDRDVPYDLYVNSSSSEVREHFVRIFPRNDTLGPEDLNIFKKKYHQLYVHESQRMDYMRSLIHLDHGSATEKGDIIKGFAISYLDNIFKSDKEFSTDVLSHSIEGCKVAVESMVDVIKDYDVSQIQNLIATLSFHDFYTYDHSINVSMYCIGLFKAIKPTATKEELVLAGLGGLLHDLGKIKLTTDIINKPEKLTDQEFELIKKHPDFGKQLLEDNPCEICKDTTLDFNVISRIIHEHHENYNGSGYPQQLAGNNIHLLARVTAVADFFDAVTTKRSYHEVLTTEDAINIMSKSVGKKLDPVIFEFFTKNVKQLVMSGKKVYQELPDSFDPCQPQNVLPFQTAKPSYKIEGFTGKEKEEFGKVKGDPKKKVG